MFICVYIDYACMCHVKIKFVYWSMCAYIYTVVEIAFDLGQMADPELYW